MKKQPKLRENRGIKETEHTEGELYKVEEIPEKDGDSIDIIPNSKTLTAKVYANK